MAVKREIPFSETAKIHSIGCTDGNCYGHLVPARVMTEGQVRERAWLNVLNTSQRIRKRVLSA